MKAIRSIAVFAAAAAFAACSEARVTDLGDENGPAQIDRVVPQVLDEAPMRVVSQIMCVTAGSRCGEQVGCCSGSFCSSELFVYGDGECTRPLEDGAFCRDNAHCASGLCIDNACRATRCLAVGESCYGSDIQCCDGSFCNQDENAYGAAFCSWPLANNEFCVEDGECASTHCIGNMCRANACLAAGDSCYEAQDACCGGTFCSFTRGAYGIAVCIPPLETGAFCDRAEECASGSCVDNICSAS